MANLGSENTPIEGESFGLPSGYSFDEENGDLVIRDTDGTVAMRRADGTWELESDLALNENDISGVGAFDSESVNTEQASIGIISDYTKNNTDEGTVTLSTDETAKVAEHDRGRLIFVHAYNLDNDDSTARLFGFVFRAGGTASTNLIEIESNSIALSRSGDGDTQIKYTGSGTDIEIGFAIQRVATF